MKRKAEEEERGMQRRKDARKRMFEKRGKEDKRTAKRIKTSSHADD